VPEARIVAPLVIFFAMGGLILWLLWRVVVAGGRARRENASGRAADEIARRVEGMLADLLVVVDEVRRRRIGPAQAAPTLSAAQQALARQIAEAAPLCRGGEWASTAAALVADIEQAQRAIELIAHGGELLEDATGVGWGEGETSVKRGYLNLVHAREAIHERRETIAVVSQARRSGLSG
jgi:hypothetical protein